jgi:hypothetical protein
VIPIPKDKENNMGKLVKNHLARLIILTASSYQVAASLEALFWPKIFGTS